MKPEGSELETAIGLEVHVRLLTRTKLFCGCPSQYGGPPNTKVCPVCLGLPGALPVTNRRAVALAVRAALALECRVRARSEFARKHYFYPDLPKGYQITQYERPLAEHGVLHPGFGGGGPSVRIRRVHLEEDAARLVHDRFGDRTAADYNRAGTPLAEVVTEPDLRSPAETRRALVRLRQVLRDWAGVTDASMEEGSLRVDANLSVSRRGAQPSKNRVEIKNLNSFSHVEKAVSIEERRVRTLLGAGGRVMAETRLFDPRTGGTRPLRSKEEERDYRYFPEPDLAPLLVDAALIERERAALPGTPHRVETRLAEGYGLPLPDAVRVAATPGRVAFFEEAGGGEGGELAGEVARLLVGPLTAEANRRGAPAECLLPPAALRRVAELRLVGRLSARTAARALQRLAAGEGGGDADAVVRSAGLAQVGDERRVEGWAREAVAADPGAAARYRAGETKLIDHFMAAVMRRARGRADPAVARTALRRVLAASAEEESDDGGRSAE